MTNVPERFLAVNFPDGILESEKREVLDALHVLAARFDYGVATNAGVDISYKRVVPWNEYVAFARAYERRADKSWDRFGQAFYNELLSTKYGMIHSDPDLFYCKDYGRAREIALKYVIFDQ